MIQIWLAFAGWFSDFLTALMGVTLYGSMSVFAFYFGLVTAKVAVQFLLSNLMSVSSSILGLDVSIHFDKIEKPKPKPKPKPLPKRFVPYRPASQRIGANTPLALPNRPGRLGNNNPLRLTNKK